MTRLLVVAILAVLSCAVVVQAIDHCGTLTGEQNALCLRCRTLGRRGGCSSCESFGGSCRWLVSNDEPQSATCVSDSVDIEYLNELWKGIGAKLFYRHAPEMCPKNPDLAHPIQFRDPATKTKVKAQQLFPFAVDSDNAHHSFCDFPTNPYYVDRWAHSYDGFLKPIDGHHPHMCEISRLHLGVWYGSPEESMPSWWLENRAVDKKSLQYLISNYCKNPCFKRDGSGCKRNVSEVADSASLVVRSTNPWTSYKSLECIRAIQSAYCSVACPAYNKAQGRLCANTKHFRYLYDVCEPWTYGYSEYVANGYNPLKNNCPLDPNNLPWDQFSDAFCDDDPFRLDASGYFEKTFGLWDPLEDELGDKVVALLVY